MLANGQIKPLTHNSHMIVFFHGWIVSTVIVSINNDFPLALKYFQANEKPIESPPLLPFFFTPCFRLHARIDLMNPVNEAESVPDVVTGCLILRKNWRQRKTNTCYRTCSKPWNQRPRICTGSHHLHVPTLSPYSNAVEVLNRIGVVPAYPGEAELCPLRWAVVPRGALTYCIWTVSW